MSGAELLGHFNVCRFLDRVSQLQKFFFKKRVFFSKHFLHSFVYIFIEICRSRYTEIYFDCFLCMGARFGHTYIDVFEK